MEVAGESFNVIGFIPDQRAFVQEDLGHTWGCKGADKEDFSDNCGINHQFPRVRCSVVMTLVSTDARGTE